ncbi:sigma-54-dependent Fis family transcriptional regulator [Tistrella bauzanensis]|uniref:sigma-54-dependent Fis family transcriptional regulator n=1 Tax=Tistrella TaxID=171436 RepID=UPI0031F6857A
MSQHSGRQIRVLDGVRGQFRDAGSLPDNAVPEVIGRSWQRCASAGLAMNRPARQDPLAAPALRRQRDRNHTLLHLATPELDLLARAMADADGVAILTDARGLILDARGDDGFAGRARRVFLQPGACWSETHEGTNAVGTALAEGGLVEVDGAEHYLDENRVLICTAMPVRDPTGRIAGVLDLSGDARRPQTHARALVRLAVANLEHRWTMQAAEADGSDLLVRLHSHPSWLGTPHEGLLAFRDGRLSAANRIALGLLGLDAGAIGAAGWDALFDGSIIDGGRPGGGVVSGDARLLTSRAGGVPMHLRISRPAGRPVLHPVTAPSRLRAAAPTLPATIPPALTLRGAMVWDAASDAMLARATRAIDADIPVLLQGETGTGKEVFVRAAHQASTLRSAPLVAVNCAAIPEGLLESELFGYEDGAFTGARRRGSPGRIRQAEGGILFLDEIGDMALGLQARLLRVLQDGEVLPLGAGRPVTVRFRLVAATHQDLKAAVADGRFRSDLYYRLNYLSVTLRPLRDRQPLDAIIDAVFQATGAPARDITLDPAARQCLAGHDWPGNLRELANLLRTLVALADDGSTITPADLPGEIGAARPLGPPMPLPQACLPHTAPVFAAPMSDAAPMASLRSMTDDALTRALAAHDGNISAAARALGIHRATLHRRLKSRQHG